MARNVSFFLGLDDHGAGIVKGRGVSSSNSSGGGLILVREEKRGLDVFRICPEIVGWQRGRFRRQRQGSGLVIVKVPMVVIVRFSVI